MGHEQAELNKERVIAIASAAFRERGFDGVAIAELMARAGLTHGGFYMQFGSKEGLMALATLHASRSRLDLWDKLGTWMPGDALGPVVRQYLSPEHARNPGEGCPVPALASEAARGPASVKATLTQGIKAMICSLARLAPGRSHAAKRERAMVVLSSMIGAVLLARACDDTALGDEVLRSVETHLLK